MSNSHEQHPNKSTLPIVGEGVQDTRVGEFQTSFLINEAYWRMANEQPVLIDQMADYIQQSGRDDTEKTRMMEAMVLTYRLLEAQAEADAMNAAFTEPTPGE